MTRNSQLVENGRTHEPSLRELCAELDGFKKLMDERDRRYSELDAANKAAVSTAMVAAEKAVGAALAAAEKASAKTEEALKEYKVGANEWRDTVKDLIGNLRESRSQEMGQDTQHDKGVDFGKWIIVQTIALITALLGAGFLISRSGS